jgi:hypothetical protein
MKGTIIGSDFIQSQSGVKIIEINTNSSIYNDGAELLDYDKLFNVLLTNNIKELHFIYTEGATHTPQTDTYRFEDKLKEKCIDNGISYYPYIVPSNSITVPYIEDVDDRFILRQSFDTTAIIDDTYCADKFKFYELMQDTGLTPKTFINSNIISIDTLTTIENNGNEPNIIKKHRFPMYNQKELPAIYSIEDDTQFNSIKDIMDLDNELLQEFVYGEENIIDNRYTVIRSIDIIYGSDLDIINMGGYRVSTIIPTTFSENELVENTRQFNQKTRYKYITKHLGNFSIIDYHTDDDSFILNYNGTLQNVDEIQLGDYIKSIDFKDFNGNNAGSFEEGKFDVFGWDGTLQYSNDTLESVKSELVDKQSTEVDTIFIRITLENGLSWTDSPSCTYYIEESGSLSTRFEKVNNMYIGDKLVITDSETKQLTTISIIGLELEHAKKTVYGLDFEPSDLFLVDIGDGLFSVMHNQCWCPWNWCGYFCHQTFCPTCFGGGGKGPI